MGLRAWRIRVGVALLALVLVGTLFSIAASGQEDSVTLGVSPQILDITTNPGQTSTNTFRLTNASDDTVSVKAIPKNFVPRGEEGAVDLTEEKTTYSLAEWVDVEPATVKIEAGKTQDFLVVITVPANAEPGSHFGSVVFQTVPPEQEGSGALVAQEIAPVILVRIAGDTTETAEIEEFKSAQDLYSNETTITLLSRIKNTGNVHFKPKGQIVIKNMFGKEVASLSLDEKNVLPDSIRQITTEWTPDGFTIGRHTASLTIIFGDNDEIRTSETSFIVFPYQTIIPVVLVLAIAGFVVYRGRKRIARAFRVLAGNDKSEK